MEVGGRPTFGGMEKAFSTNILARLDEFFAKCTSVDHLGRKAGQTVEHGRKCRKTSRRSNNRVQVPWASLLGDMLVSIMLKLSIIDYFAFSGVCKSWRSVAIDSRKRYMEYQQPLAVIRSVYAKKTCLLYNMFDGTSYKAMLPDLCGRRFVGLSSGYLITMDKNMGFWLVNLMTRHELHFPDLPGHLSYFDAEDMCPPILFQSTRLSKVYMIVFIERQNWLMLSESGSSSWQEHLVPNSSQGISDVKISHGKIYVLTFDARLCVFNPGTDAVLKLYKVNIQLESSFELKLVTSGDKLCLIIYSLGDISFFKYLALYELDLKNMESVKQIDDLGANSLFVSVYNSAMVDTTGWGAGNCICFSGTTFLNEWTMFHLNGNMLATAPLLWDAPAHWEPYYWYFPKESCDIISVDDEFGV